MKSTKLLVAIVGLQVLTVAGQWLGQPSVVSTASAQVPDAGAQTPALALRVAGHDDLVGREVAQGIGKRDHRVRGAHPPPGKYAAAGQPAQTRGDPGPVAVLQHPPALTAARLDSTTVGGHGDPYHR